MIKPHLLLLFILITCLALLGCENSDSADAEATAPPKPTLEQDQQAVKDVFEAYRFALVHGDGDTAANNVSTGTIAQYEKRLELALTATKEQLQNEKLSDRLSALMLRHRMMPHKLREMDGRSIFAHAVDYGWIGREVVEKWNVRSVAVDGDRAAAQAGVDDSEGTRLFHFLRENGSWKLNLLATSQQTDLVLASQAREIGITNDELLFRILAGTTGRPPSDSIWEPVGE